MDVRKMATITRFLAVTIFVPCSPDLGFRCPVTGQPEYKPAQAFSREAARLWGSGPDGLVEPGHPVMGANTTDNRLRDWPMKRTGKGRWMLPEDHEMGDPVTQVKAGYGRGKGGQDWVGTEAVVARLDQNGARVQPSPHGGPRGLLGLYLPAKSHMLFSFPQEKVMPFIGLEEKGMSLLFVHKCKLAMLYLERGPNRVGSVYKKAVYKHYTDETYSTEIPKPPWLGFLGPILRVEVEDVVVIHLKNFASRPYSLHPHGVFYAKDSEGALYPDGTSGKNKDDDMVLPGRNYTYVWSAKEEYAPTPADANCLTWVYHSHIDAPKDICSGLIGPLLVCKRGTLSGYVGTRADVDKEFVLMFTLVDENQSWYLDENIEHFCSDPDTVDKNDAVFQRSNKMHALNGFLFGNLPEPAICAGESVSWHLFGMGNEIDVHSIYFYGNTVSSRGHRSDVVNLFPATFLTTEMRADNAGKWMITCQVSDHLQAGMVGQYSVETCRSGGPPKPKLQGRRRSYFIAAEKVLWDYGPAGYDKFTGLPLNATGSDSEPFFTQGDARIGGKYWKVQYVEFTDATFTRRKSRSERGTTHLGILGPVIKAEVGDTLSVTFSNRADKAYSVLPHGVFYSKESDAAPNEDGFQKMGAHVLPGETFTYKWTVPESVSPLASDPPCLTYLYFSAVDPIKDTSSGLVGPLVICKPNSLNEDGTQKGIDKEFYLLFTVFDENLSWYLDQNIQKFTLRPFGVDKEDKEFVKSNRMPAVNGYMYGNQPGLNMCKEDKVSWHLFGLGTDTDMHGVHFQGNTVHWRGTHRDTVALFPHSSLTAFMQPDHTGIFKMVCRTMDHFTRGMKQIYEVNTCGNPSAPAQPHGTIRVFYIAAEEVEWDYAPNKNWELEKQHMDFGRERYGEIFMNHTEKWIGSQYKKVVYREYTNGEFVEIKARSPREEHLEILGPMIRAEVGDSVLIVFKNKAKRPYSIAAHGVEDMDGGKRLEVPNTRPGEIKTYRWNIPKRSGPGPSDPNCISWVYYSTADFVKDTYSGLIGPLITCREGILNEMGRRSDVDYEFALLFLIFNENESWYLDENIKNHLDKDPADFKPSDDFEKSNRMHAINGKIYGNLHGLVIKEDSKTDWYLLGMGTEVDIHTVHFHAESFIFKMDKSYREDVHDLFPGTFQTIELIADHPGTWLLHCHVTDHIHAGMETTYTVLRNIDNRIPYSTKVPFEEAAPPATIPTDDGSNQERIHFLGKKLDPRGAKAALVSLFIIGSLLLVAVVVLFLSLRSVRRRMAYRAVHTCALPTDTL
ncbi:ferroxidase HEPHL1 [Ornithorhynchus anatinus]|uniref:ferroxidase HEPHL1 n=1 Tax=Ornithorhynchus anatinus TaxID=9258 RepID=UPI0019D49CFE|nr:ferroxidase HEPHL1 [Ornithorhynchus anatinus]